MELKLRASINHLQVTQAIVTRSGIIRNEQCTMGLKKFARKTLKRFSHTRDKEKLRKYVDEHFALGNSFALERAVSISENDFPGDQEVLPPFVMLSDREKKPDRKILKCSRLSRQLSINFYVKEPENLIKTRQFCNVISNVSDFDRFRTDRFTVNGSYLHLPILFSLFAHFSHIYAALAFPY
jgi:hypothetical protein